MIVTTDDLAEREKNKEYLTYLGSDWGGLHVDMSLIPPGSTIISAGLADDISFDMALIEKKQCYVVGIDPTKLAAKTVRRYNVRNFLKKKHFTLLRYALHDRSGLIVRLGGPAKTFLSPRGSKAETLSINDLVSMYPGASLLKMDIEGAEFPVLESLNKMRVPQIGIGFHVWLNSESDTCPNDGVVPSFYTKQDVLDCVEHIKGMGYKLVFESREHPERIGQETLFVRNDFAEKFNDLILR